MKSKDGTDIAYPVYGKGEPAIVVIHGWSCDQSYWKNKIDPRSKNFTVDTIELAGH